MKVVTDEELCVGNGLCEALAPDVFETTGEGRVRVLVDVVADDDQDVAEAVASCPMQALRLEQGR